VSDRWVGGGTIIFYTDSCDFGGKAGPGEHGANVGDKTPILTKTKLCTEFIGLK